MALQTSNQTPQKRKSCDASYRTCFKTAWTYIPILHHSKVNIAIQVNWLCFLSRILPTITENNIWVGKSTKRLSTCFTGSILSHCYTSIYKKNSINSKKTKINFPAEGAFTYKNCVTRWTKENQKFRSPKNAENTCSSIQRKANS